MQQHNDATATAVRTLPGTHCLTTTGEARAPWPDAPARPLVRSHVPWPWLAGLLLTMLVGAPRVFAIPTCGDGVCQDTGPFAETDKTCPVDCGGGFPGCNDICENGACDRPGSGVDKDRDGIPDRLEYDLAHKFFPNLWLQTFDYDLATSYLFQGKALPFMVSPYREPETACDEEYECLEIRYGIASFYDYGYPCRSVFPMWVVSRRSMSVIVSSMPPWCGGQRPILRPRLTRPPGD